MARVYLQYPNCLIMTSLKTFTPADCNPELTMPQEILPSDRMYDLSCRMPFTEQLLPLTSSLLVGRHLINHLLDCIITQMLAISHFDLQQDQHAHPACLCVKAPQSKLMRQFTTDSSHAALTISHTFHAFEGRCCDLPGSSVQC